MWPLAGRWKQVFLRELVDADDSKARASRLVFFVMTRHGPHLYCNGAAVTV
jgi:hypothetical protein